MAATLVGNATKERLFAATIDNFLAMMICVLFASRLPGDLSPLARWGIAGAAYLTYFLVQEAIWGTTIGKRVFHLRVSRLDGSEVGWSDTIWRTLLRVLEVNPLLAGAIPGGLAVAFSKRKQRLGDMLAGTVVVHQKVLEAVHERTA